jgi:membrane protease YdiL (CAAX protease family)
LENSKLDTYPSIAQSFLITGIIILVMMLVSLATPTLNKLVGNEAAVLLYQILAMGIPFLIVFTIRKRKSARTSFNLTLQDKSIIPIIIVAGIVLLLGVVGPISGLIPVPESMKQAFAKAASHTGLSTFILMVIAAPVLEELIFRGIILDGLLRRYSPKTSILISSLLFAIVHLNPWQFVTGFIMGAFIGWVYYKTKSLLAAIIIHASANFSVYFLRFFIDSSMIDKTYIESVGGVTSFVLILLGSILVVSICIYFLKREFRNKLQTD